MSTFSGQTPSSPGGSSNGASSNGSGQHRTTPHKPLKDTVVGKGGAGPVKWLDERVGLAGLARKHVRKVFPDHWSFMLG